MTEELSKCETSINSIANIDVSRRELVKFLDRIKYVDESLKGLEKDQKIIQKRISEISSEVDKLITLYYSVFGEQIRGVTDAGVVEAELLAERENATKTPEQITLGMSEITKEQILSIMDAIKRIDEESRGHPTKEAVLARAKVIGISDDDFEDILRRLKRAGALVESEGALKLI